MTVDTFVRQHVPFQVIIFRKCLATYLKCNIETLTYDELPEILTLHLTSPVCFLMCILSPRYEDNTLPQ